MQNEERQTLEAITAAGEIAAITIESSVAQTARLATLLKKGCFVRVRTGCSMKELLCEQFNINPEYVRKEIKVIFLNFSPVDDLDTAIIKDGSIIALSAAMPGLVGAAMSRDGLSWMRSSITYHEEAGEHAHQDGLIHMKLFNKVMADHGESFLRRGVYVKSGFLADFLERFDADFWRAGGKISRNGEAMTVNELLKSLKGSDEWVRFTLR
jgi:hypothetical protein